MIISLTLKICEVVSFLGSVTIIVRYGGSLLSEAILLGSAVSLLPLLIVLHRFYRSSNGSSITAWGDVCRWDCIPSYQHIALVLYDPRTQIFGFDGKIVVFA